MVDAFFEIRFFAMLLASAVAERRGREAARKGDFLLYEQKSRSSPFACAPFACAWPIHYQSGLLKRGQGLA
jgi:hypothetical protein